MNCSLSSTSWSSARSSLKLSSPLRLRMKKPWAIPRERRYSSRVPSTPVFVSSGSQPGLRRASGPHPLLVDVLVQMDVRRRLDNLARCRVVTAQRIEVERAHGGASALRDEREGAIPRMLVRERRTRGRERGERRAADGLRRDAQARSQWTINAATR